MAKESSQGRHGPEPHRVVVIVDENSNPFELGCATEVFGLRRPELGRDLYDFRLCSPEPRTLMRDGFFTLTGVAGLEAADEADTLIVPNRPDVEVPRRPAVLDAVRRAHARGARLLGFCSGAFTLAEAGVLDGRRATAHWQWADEFRTRFPSVRLEPDVLFVDDGDILTAAGSAAALDLGLHVVRRDHGAEVANSVSRRLVFAAHRDGGQRQFVERPMPDLPDESLAPVLAWAQERLDAPLTVADLAARAAVSPATLHRRFQAQLGTTPLTWHPGTARPGLPADRARRVPLRAGRPPQRPGHRSQPAHPDAPRDRHHPVGVQAPLRPLPHVQPGRRLRPTVTGGGSPCPSRTQPGRRLRPPQPARPGPGPLSQGQ